MQRNKGPILCVFTLNTEVGIYGKLTGSGTLIFVDQNCQHSVGSLSDDKAKKQCRNWSLFLSFYHCTEYCQLSVTVAS